MGLAELPPARYVEIGEQDEGNGDLKDDPHDAEAPNKYDRENPPG